MNLNGQNSRSTTILNGKPLYGYDRAKKDKAVKHGNWHKKTSEYSRTHIGTVRMAPQKTKRDKSTASIVVKAVVLFIILWLILFKMHIQIRSSDKLDTWKM